MNEQKAVVQLKAGDVGGLKPLVRRHQVRALRTAHLIVGDPLLAQDVVQDAFLRAFDRIGSFDAERPFAPWFMRIVVNGSVDAASRARQQTIRETATDNESAWEALGSVDQEPGPHHVAEEADCRQSILNLLEELPPRYRAAIVQRYYLGMSEAEMAKDGSISVGTVKWRLHTARKKLSRLLRSSAYVVAPIIFDQAPNGKENYEKA